MEPQRMFFLMSIILSLHGASATLQENCKRIAQPPQVTYQSCIITFQGNPSSNTADIPGLGVISTNLAVAKARAIESHIAELLTSTGDNRVKEALKTCSEQYNRAIDDAGLVIRSFQGKDYDTANINLSAWRDTPSGCDKGFRELKVASPLTNDNSVFLSVVEIPLRISYFLTTGN